MTLFSESSKRKASRRVCEGLATPWTPPPLALPAAMDLGRTPSARTVHVCFFGQAERLKDRTPKCSHTDS